MLVGKLWIDPSECEIDLNSLTKIVDLCLLATYASNLNIIINQYSTTRYIKRMTSIHNNVTDEIQFCLRFT